MPRFDKRQFRRLAAAFRTVKPVLKSDPSRDDRLRYYTRLIQWEAMIFEVERMIREDRTSMKTSEFEADCNYVASELQVEPVE